MKSKIKKDKKMRNTERQKDILVTLVTLVTLFWSANQFYRAECIIVSRFFNEILPCLFPESVSQSHASYLSRAPRAAPV